MQLKFTSADRPVILLRLKGDRSSEAINHESAINGWYSARDNITLVLVAVPLTIGERLINDLIRDVSNAYEGPGCRVLNAFYSPVGAEIIHQRQ